MIGTPPWTFTYTNGSSTKAETMVEKSPVTIFVRGSEMSGRIWFGEIFSHLLLSTGLLKSPMQIIALEKALTLKLLLPCGRFQELILVVEVISVYILLDIPGVICVGSKTYLNLTLSGEAPWTVEYTDGEITEIVSDINTTPYLVEVSKPGTYYLTAITDQHCSYKRKK